MRSARPRERTAASSQSFLPFQSFSFGSFYQVVFSFVRRRSSLLFPYRAHCVFIPCIFCITSRTGERGKGGSKDCLARLMKTLFTLAFPPPPFPTASFNYPLPFPFRFLCLLLPMTLVIIIGRVTCPCRGNPAQHGIAQHSTAHAMLYSLSHSGTHIQSYNCTTDMYIYIVYSFRARLVAMVTM